MLSIRFFAAIFIVSVLACVSTGPVQTQIDKNLNSVVKKPKEFQSPLDAIERGYEQLLRKEQLSVSKPTGKIPDDKK